MSNKRFYPFNNLERRAGTSDVLTQKEYNNCIEMLEEIKMDRIIDQGSVLKKHTPCHNDRPVGYWRQVKDEDAYDLGIANQNLSRHFDYILKYNNRDVSVIVSIGEKQSIAVSLTEGTGDVIAHSSGNKFEDVLGDVLHTTQTVCYS